MLILLSSPVKAIGETSARKQRKTEPCVGILQTGCEPPGAVFRAADVAGALQVRGAVSEASTEPRYITAAASPAARPVTLPRRGNEIAST